MTGTGCRSRRDDYPGGSVLIKLYAGFLRQMNREVLSQYETITVGETPNATVEDCLRKVSAAAPGR